MRSEGKLRAQSSEHGGRRYEERSDEAIPWDKTKLYKSDGHCEERSDEAIPRDQNQTM